MILKDAHAKAQRRKEIQMSKAQSFFSPLRLCVSICLLSFAVGAAAETTNDLSDAEMQGRALAQKILEQQPTENSTNFGILKIRDAHGNYTNFVMNYKIIVLSNSWQNIYEVTATNLGVYKNQFVQAKLFVNHVENQMNSYGVEARVFAIDSHTNKTIWTGTMVGQYLFRPFAYSDFWIADLGLEFFHWPVQKVLKKEVHRSRGCTVLESTNPNPSTNGYSRVVSWIDEESLGIVEAYAYDANGKLLKDFYPKDFKKMDGQWQVQTLVMENVQTGSRSRLEFDLNKK
jgi:hypothetical protein